MLWGQLSDKADVFSFGVLLLEIVSGKRNRDPSLPEDQVYLPNRVCFLSLLNLSFATKCLYYNYLKMEHTILFY